MLRWFGEQLKEQTGDSDITFKEVSEFYHQSRYNNNKLYSPQSLQKAFAMGRERGRVVRASDL